MIPRSVRLRDGREVEIRFRRKDDAENLYEMYSSMSPEALEWVMAPYTRELIDRWFSLDDQVIAIVATSGDWIVGHSAAFMYEHPRFKGCSDLGIQLHQDFHGVGLGSMMTELLIQLATDAGVHRLSLRVVSENKAARNLYEKHEFEVEGKMRDAFYGRDEQYYDMLVMGRLLGDKFSSQR